MVHTMSGAHADTRRWRRLAPWVLLAAALTSFLWWEQDDFYIHLQYARNLATGGGWSFNYGQPAYGTTSPLWVVALALCRTAGLDLIFSAKTLSLLAGIATLTLLARADDLLPSPRARWGCAASLALNHWYRLSVGGGMESSLAGALALAAVLMMLRGVGRVSQGIAVGVLVGALALTRPEFLGVLPIVVIAASTQWRLRTLMVASAAATLLPWLLFASATFGTIVPLTATLKAFATRPIAAMTLTDVTTAVRRVTQFYGATNLVDVVGALLLAWLILRAWRSRRLADARILDEASLSLGRALALLAIAAWIPVLYTVNQARGNVEISYRYAAPMLPVLALAGWIGLTRALPSLTAARQRWLWRGVAAWCVATNLAVSAAHTPFLLDSRHYVRGILLENGRWLRTHTNDGILIGAYDVGALAYASERRVLDLVGLNAPDAAALRLAHPEDGFAMITLDRIRPDYVMSPTAVPLPAYRSLLPPHTVVRANRVRPYRFFLRELWQPRTPSEVALIALHWDRREP